MIDLIKKSIEDIKSSKTEEAKNELKKTTLLLEEPNHRFEELKNIHCPVLVMAGENDIVKPGHTKGIAANIPGAELYIAPGKTHYLPQEDAKLFNSKVLEFLQKK